MRVMMNGMLHEELRPIDHNMASELQVNSKRQRRPSVRLGEIGDEPMPLVLQKLFKRRKTQPHPENLLSLTSDQTGNEIEPLVQSRVPKQVEAESAEDNHVEHVNDDDCMGNEDSHENLEAEDAGQGLLSHPLRRVPVGLKKRTKRGKLAKRKRIIANRSVLSGASSAKSAKLLEQKAMGNSLSPDVNDISDAIVGAPVVQTDSHEPENTASEQKENRDIVHFWQDNDDRDQVKQCEENEKISRKEEHYMKALEADEAKHEYNAGVVATVAATVNLEAGRDATVSSRCDSEHIAADHDLLMRDKEELPYSVDQKGTALNCDVRKWLEALNLGRYAQLFEVHEVDWDVLPLLTIEDLKEMGIVAVGPRRKMFAAIQALNPKDLILD